MSDTHNDGDGQHGPLQGDFLQWLTACHDAVSNLNTNLEAVTVCLKNVSGDLVTLIRLMDVRPTVPRLEGGGGGQSPVHDS